jgi:NADPH:quinone reductase-like Zn-dependent oxidoreductase
MARNYSSAIALTALGTVACAAAAFLALRPSPDYRLDGKVVLVTGGSRGLGLILAREFVSRGAIVAICARNEQELMRVREEFAVVGENSSRFNAI